MEAAVKSAAQTTTTLSTADLQSFLDLLALAADRGAFKIEEFEDVGALWRKLAGFVQSSKS